MNAQNLGKEISEISRNSNNASKFIDEAERFAQEICKTTDLGLNRFRLNHQDIFDKIGGLNLKTHRLLAHEIVNSKDVTIDEIKKLLSDPNVDSNIRMEILFALCLRGENVDKDTFHSIKSNIIKTEELNDGVLKAFSSSYNETLVVFLNGKVVKGILESVKEEKDNVFIYTFSGNRIYNSRGEVIKR